MSPLASYRLCTYPGCGAITKGPRCQRHLGLERKHADLGRGTAAQRGYGGRWQKARATWLGAHPLCVGCQGAGRLVTATVVDHIVPHKGDQGLFWDSDNWQPLCKACHDRKTARENGGWNR